MTSAMQDLNLAHLWIVYPGEKSYALAPKISTLPITARQAGWPYDG